MRVVLAVLFLLIPGIAAATSCVGTDLRGGLSAAQWDRVADALEGEPFPEGNHWVATRGADTLHLVGTVHVHDPRLLPVAERLRPVIAAADRLLMEAAPGDDQRVQRYLAENPQFIRITGGSLIDRLPDAEWQSLAALARQHGIPPAMAAQMQPWLLSITLAIPPCVGADAAAGLKGLDDLLWDIGADTGTPIEALESWTTVIDVFAADPIEDQIAALRLGIVPLDLGTDMMVTLIEQYFEERHTAIFPLNRVLVKDALDIPEEVFHPLFETMLEKLLYERNRNWMPHLLAAKGTSVVAVGAGHLGGSGGLLDLLSQEGFALRRAAF